MSKFSEKYKQFFEEDEGSEIPTYKDCARCKLRKECEGANMMTIDPRCLINGVSLQSRGFR